MTTLTANTLTQLGPVVARPTYDRRRVQTGIVHIGVGGFHRAHEALYMDDLLQSHGVTGWAICGVGLRDVDRKMGDALRPQDGLYTLVERSATADQARVIGSLTEFLFAPDDPEAVLRKMADAGTHIVSLTITENGYNYNQTTGEFLFDSPDIAHDLAHPERPVSVFGFLTEALDRRRRAGLPPFTVLSCDNLQGNGDRARRTLLAFAGRRDPALGDWIAAHVAFPNSMVDRITPQTTEASRDLVRDEFGIEDAWPVVAEPFRQWILEDTFSDGRPPLEALQSAGVLLTQDVYPYEMMKLRLLNAGHSAIGYLGYLAGHSYIHEIMADPVFQKYIRLLMDDEVTPLLPPVPGVDLTEYKYTLRTRFANPKIADQTLRICLDGSAKMPKYLLPSLQEQIARGGPTRLLTLAVAGWFRFLSGTDEQGRPIPIDDPQADILRERAQHGPDPRPLLALTDLFGDLGQSTAFVRQLETDLQSLYAHGSCTTLAAVLGAYQL